MLRDDIQERLDNLSKPKGSLGFLEEIAMKMALIQGKIIPELPRRKAVFVFAGDHGIVEENVSAYPKDVTPEMVENFLHGGAAINVFSRHTGSDVYVVDAGVDHDFSATPGLIGKKVGYGSHNFAKGPAMSEEEAVLCIRYGRELADQAVHDGVELAAIGDMGIGNTATATAVIAALGCDLDSIVDIGTMIPPEQLVHKKEVIKKALQLHRPFADPMDVLRKVGSYCIGEMAGFVLGFTAAKRPVVIDGYPTSAGAFLACRIDSSVTDYLFAGHRSKVKGHDVVLREMGLRPILDLEMRLGEGTGAVLSFSIIEAAIKMMREMATFDSAGITSGNEQ